MKITNSYSNSYSDCFFQARVSLRKIIARNFSLAKDFVENGVMDLELVCLYADSLTAFNEISGYPFFVKFNKFTNG